MCRSEKNQWVKLSHALMLTLMVTFTSSHAQVFPVITIMNNGPNTNRVNLVYLSDGYTSGQLDTYITNTNTINDGMFIQTPFSQYKSYFNAFAVRVPSAESGAKHPGTASDEASSGGQPVANPNNYFNSTFDFANIHRLLVPTNGAGITSVLASNTPDYDQAFIVVNSPYYGGSGGSHATSSTHVASIEVAIHEIGHSFAGLADEYTIGGQGERPNRTTNSNPATIKWKNWLGVNAIGIYALGVDGAYRPHQNCKMQFLNSPFCSVCTEAFIDRIHQLVNMIDSYVPATSTFSLTNTNNVNFSVQHIPTVPSTITINWYLNNSPTPFATNVASVTIPYNTFISGTNTVRAEVVDNTTLSRSYTPGVGYINNQFWVVNKGTILDVSLLDFSGRINEKSEGILEWKISSDKDLSYFELEKSANGKSFSTLAKINKTEEELQYFYTDKYMSDPTNYYRLKIYDKDGSSKYSNTISLKTTIEKFSYKVYQNAIDHAYSLRIHVNEPEKVIATITNSAGQIVYSKNLGIINSSYNEEIDLRDQAAGIYFMQLQIGNSGYTVKLLAE